jgi:hypothetical protein
MRKTAPRVVSTTMVLTTLVLTILVLTILLLLATACGPSKPAAQATPVAAAAPTEAATSAPGGEEAAQAWNIPTPGVPGVSTLLSPLAASSPLAAPASGDLRLVLVHSNDTWGYLIPCG